MSWNYFMKCSMAVLANLSSPLFISSWLILVLVAIKVVPDKFHEVVNWIVGLLQFIQVKSCKLCQDLHLIKGHFSILTTQKVKDMRHNLLLCLLDKIFKLFQSEFSIVILVSFAVSFFVAYQNKHCWHVKANFSKVQNVLEKFQALHPGGSNIVRVEWSQVRVVPFKIAEGLRLK